MTETVPKLDHFDMQMIISDVDKLKSLISQIVSYAQNDYPYKDERGDSFNQLLGDMFIDFADEFEEQN